MKNEKMKQSERYSHIGMHSKSNKVYARQYKEAFDILFEANNPVDTIALPMLYLMRHYLELTLKNYIEYYNTFSDSSAMKSALKSDHNLDKLVKGFQEHWLSVVKKHSLTIDGKKKLSRLKQLIESISKIDSVSTDFRYSHDKEGEKNFSHFKIIDISSLKKNVEEIASIFEELHYVFYSEIGCHLEIEKEMYDKEYLK